MAASSTYLESLFDSKAPRRTPAPSQAQAKSSQPVEIPAGLDDVSVWQVLASQTEYLQKLEAANKRFQDESKFLRDNLRNLVEDNSRLYGELKGCLSQRIEELADKRVAASAKVNGDASEEGSGDDEEEEEEEESEVDDAETAAAAVAIATRQQVANSSIRQVGGGFERVPSSSASRAVVNSATNTPATASAAAEAANRGKSMSNLVRMHASRADRLESEVRALKTQLDSSRLIISELKASARESSAGSTSGASIQVDAESMLKLMNERDEAVGRIARLVERLNLCDQHRQALESDLRDALKLVDEAVREKQLAIDDKMRLGERISEIERRVEDERDSAEKRLEQAVKVIRAAASDQVKAAEDKMALAVAESLRHEQKAARLAREQRRLAGELEQVRLEANKFEQELSDANADFKATLARVLSDRDIALRELSRMRALTSQERGDLDTDRSRLAEQLRMARGQIADCQQELNAMAAERLQAVSQMNDALAQVEAERRQRAELESEVDAVRRELTVHAQTLKQQHEATGGELRRIVEQQADLIRRLRTECDRLLSGYSSEKSEADRLRAENALLLSRLRRSQEELGAARFDASASAQVQDALRWRMAELDARAKQAKAEVEDILQRSNGARSLSRDNTSGGAISVAVHKAVQQLKSEELLDSSDADSSLVNEVVMAVHSPRHQQQQQQQQQHQQQQSQQQQLEQALEQQQRLIADDYERDVSSGSTVGDDDGDDDDSNGDENEEEEEENNSGDDNTED